MLIVSVLLVVFFFTFKSLASYIKKIRTGDPNESDITYWMFSYNGMEFTEKARVPDAKRLFRAYSQSASTLNLLRAFSQGGFADLRQVHLWNLGFIKDKTKGKYKEIEDKISDALLLWKLVELIQITTES